MFDTIESLPLITFPFQLAHIANQKIPPFYRFLFNNHKNGKRENCRFSHIIFCLSQRQNKQNDRLRFSYYLVQKMALFRGYGLSKLKR